MTLYRTTGYDYDISIFFLVIGILFFLITLILMTQVYSFFAIIFVIPFAVHIGYIVYKDELNKHHRKYHYLWIIFTYGISYLLTQIVLYGRIDSDEIVPVDILSVNTFFLIMWLLGQMAIWNFLFLRRSLPLTKEELGEEAPSFLELVKTRYQIKLKNIGKIYKTKLQNLHVKQEEVWIFKRLEKRKISLSKNGRIKLIFKRTMFQIG